MAARWGAYPALSGASQRPGRSAVRRLAIARATSNTGSWAATIALSLVIFARTGSTLWLSASFLFTTGVAALASPFAGLISDRYDRRRVMILSDVAAAGLSAAMALTREPAVLIALGSAAVLVHAPFGPAGSAAIPNLVVPDDLAWANGTLGAAGNVGNALGPVIGGGLVAAVGARWVFLVNAASFLGSAVLIIAVRARFQGAEPRTEAASGLSGWTAGAAFLVRQPVLLILTAVGAVTFIASEVTWVADLPLIRLFDVDGVGYGLMITAWGLGALLGSLVAARLVREETEPFAAVVGTLVFGAAVSSVGLARWFPLVPAFLFVVGAADSFSVVGFTGIYQRGAPDEIRGRMFAAVGGLFALATALGFSVAGPIVATAGPRAVYTVGGLIDIAAAIALAGALRVSLGRRRSAEVGSHPTDVAS